VRLALCEWLDVEEDEIPLERSSQQTLVEFFSVFESPSRLKAFGEGSVDQGGERGGQPGLLSGGNGHPLRGQDGLRVALTYQDERRCLDGL